MQDAQIQIIPALPEHEAAIRAQSAATNMDHRARLPHVFRPTNAYQDQLLDAALHPGNYADSSFRSGIWVACRDDLPLGFALVIWNAPSDVAREGGTSAMIADIAAFDGARGQGVGTALLAHLEGMMHAQGWDSLVADVWLGNDPSHGLFQKAGFAAERTEYRLGTPPALTDTPTDETEPAPAGSKWMIAVIVLLFIFIIASIP